MIQIQQGGGLVSKASHPALYVHICSEEMLADFNLIVMKMNCQTM